MAAAAPSRGAGADFAAAATSAPAPAGARDASELRRDVWIDVRTAPDSLTVGDRLSVELRVDAPAGYEIGFPEKLPPSPAADLVEFTPPAAPEQIESGGAPKRRWTARYALAVFEVGALTLPPFTVDVRADSLHTVATTDSLRIMVASVLTDSLSAAAIRDLKPQARLQAARWPWIVAAIAAAAVLAALIWWRRRRRPRAAVVPLVRQRPADQVALEGLRRLETRRLPLDGRFQEHWVALSEIVRRYLEDGFGVAALEETTEEILFDLERHGFSRAHVMQFRALSEAGDLIKFAKGEPTIEECVRALERTRDFVVATAPRMRPAPELEAAVAAATGGEAPAAALAGAAPRSGGDVA